jgi:hypothetical protein
LDIDQKKRGKGERIQQRPPKNGMWEGSFFEEKEVSVYFKLLNDTIVLLTTKARYGKGFLREGEDHEVRI